MEGGRLRSHQVDRRDCGSKPRERSRFAGHENDITSNLIKSNNQVTRI